jgi:hypothetical protein
LRLSVSIVKDGFLITVLAACMVQHAGGVDDGNPARWVGRSLSMISAIDVGARLGTGNWAILFYDSGCGSCRDIVRDYEWLAGNWGTNSAWRVALIETERNVSPDRQLASGLSPALQGQVISNEAWFVVSPTLVVLSDGQVVSVRQGERDCKLEKSGLLR